MNGHTYLTVALAQERMYVVTLKKVTYCFWFEADKGVPDDMFYAKPLVAEPFMDHFKSSIARFHAIQSAPDVAAQLTAMHDLWSEGVLSDQEYQRSKELFLGRSPDAEQRAEKALRSLKQLLDAGVLSDSEFRSKKWQILSAG